MGKNIFQGDYMQNYSYNPKPIEELTFTDDGMFQAVLHEPDICAELVERLLHVPILYKSSK